MKCILCKAETNNKIGSVKSYSWIGDEDGNPRSFDIYDCSVCGTRCADVPHAIDYNFVFAQTDLYEEQLWFAHKLRRQEDPSWALISRGHPYFALFEHIRGKNGLEILGVGCSYGYVEYVLYRMGHSVLGMDVSYQTIQFARGMFGELFVYSDIHSFVEANPDKKYDLVFAIETIEHVEDPLGFIKSCKKALKPHGEVLITTPNRDYVQIFADRPQNPVWIMEKPPVHLAIYGRKSMEYIAKEIGMKLEIFDRFPGLAERSGSLNLVAIFRFNQ